MLVSLLCRWRFEVWISLINDRFPLLCHQSCNKSSVNPPVKQTRKFLRLFHNKSFAPENHYLQVEWTSNLPTDQVFKVKLYMIFIMHIRLHISDLMHKESEVLESLRFYLQSSWIVFITSCIFWYVNAGCQETLDFCKRGVWLLWQCLRLSTHNGPVTSISVL